MPFDQQKFDETFGFAMDKFSLDDMMTDFNLEQDASDDNFAVYKATIATKEFNNNYLYLDEQTMNNIAKASNRDTAGKDIPIFPNHNRYDFQMGTMLTGKYIKSRNRVEGTFNIIRDPQTEVLINRINNRVVRGVSPTIKGDAFCDIDGEKMYRYGGSKSGYYLGETVKIDGKERIVTATFKNAQLIEVSVVSMQAFPGATIFSENQALLQQALAEGVIDDKALDMIEYSFSLDLSGVNRTHSIPPNPKPNGGKPVSKPTDADTQLLQDQVTDLTQQVTDKDKQITAFSEQVTELEKRPTVEEFQAKETALTEANQKLIETQGKLGTAEATVAEYDAGVEHIRTKAIEFYAKVRGVEADNTTDPLFVNRKKNLQDSKSLTYLLGAFEQYQQDYYASTTQFGGQATKPQTSPAVPSDYTPASGLM